MTKDHAEYWDEHVQPRIDRDHPERADQAWDWPVIWRFIRWLGKGLRQEPMTLTLDVELSDGRLIPCGMFAGMLSYPFPVRPDAKSCFVWFMTAAPPEVLPKLLGCSAADAPRRLTRFCLDIGLTLSFRRGHDGRVWLHASPAGARLPAWYEEQGMANLMQQVKLPFGPRALLKPNDGRYFYYDEPRAVDASKALDEFREAVEGK